MEGTDSHSETSSTFCSSFQEAFEKIIKIRIPDAQPPILFKYKTPEKKIAEERKRINEIKAKLSEKEKLRNKAYNKETDVVLEKKFKKLALKGVVKMFNSITRTQREDKKLKKLETKFKQSERFKRRHSRVNDSSGRKILKYDAVQAPKWDVLREDYMTVA
jgi:hypothetical protein